MTCVAYENYEEILQTCLDGILAKENHPTHLKYLEEKYNFIHEEMLGKDWEGETETDQKGVQEKLLKQMTRVALFAVLKHVGLLTEVASQEM